MNAAWRLARMMTGGACRRSLVGVLAAAVLGAGAAHAEADKPVQLESATATAVPVESLLTDEPALVTWLGSRHPDLGAAKARVRQAEALVDQSRVIPNPVLGVGVGGITLGRRNPSNLSFGDTMNFSVGLSETIELGKRGPRARAAELRRDASRASATDVLLTRLVDARNAMARAIYYAERGRVLSERLASAQNVVSLEQVRLEHGDISGIEHDRLELEAAAVARELADNSGDLADAIADCSAVLMGDCSHVTASMDAVDASVPLAMDANGFDALVRERPDIRAARLSVAAAQTDATLYRRQAIPDPTVGVTYIRDFLTEAGNQPNTLLASVSLPLPLFDHGQHLAKASDASARELAFQVRSVEIRAIADARALFAQQEMLRKKLDVLVSTSLPKAVAVLHASDDAYHHGQLSLTDLIIVRREHAALVLESVETRFQLFAVRNELHRTLGLGATRPPSTPAASATPAATK